MITPLEPERILIVDDEPRILTTLADLFDEAFEVQTCTSASEALDALSRRSFAVILCDQRMPGMTGDEFLSRARALSEATRILITGYADLDAVVRSVNRGQIYAYVAKPWDPGQLRALVERAAEHCRLLYAAEHERELLRSLLESSTDVIFFKDDQRRFMRLNQVTSDKLGGRPAQALIGLRVEDLGVLDAATVASVRDEEEALLADGQRIVDRVACFSGPDGRKQWMSTSKARLTSADGRVTGLIGIGRDVTDRELAAEALRDSEGRFRDFASIASDWFWESDRQHRLTWISERKREVTGLPLATFIGRRRDELETFHAEPAAWEAHLAVLDARHPFRSFEYSRRNAEGYPVWLAVSGVPVFDEAGEFLGYRGTGTDITARKRAEEAVALVNGIALQLNQVTSGQDALRLTLDHICRRLGWIIGEAWLAAEHGAELVLQECWQEDDLHSREYCRASLAGRIDLEAGLVGQAVTTGEAVWCASIASASSEDFLSRDRALAAGAGSACAIPVTFEQRVIAVLVFMMRGARDGDSHWTSALAAATAPLGAALERLAAQDARRQADERLDIAMRAANVGGWRWDVATERLQVDEHTARLFGRTPAEMPVDFEGTLALVDEEDRTRLRVLYASCLTHENAFAMDFSIERPDGARRVIHMQGQVYRDAEGRSLRISGISSDVTVQRQTEAKLRQVQKMEAVGQLTGGVAHDFNNRLTVIIGNLELLEMRCRHEPTQLPLVESALRAAGGGVKLTRQLLSFARQHVLEAEVFEPGTAFAGMREVLERTLTAAIDLQLRSGEDIWSIRTDRSQFDDVLINLAINARDALPNGGRVVIEAQNLSLGSGVGSGQHYMMPGDYVLVAVTDNGAGIPKTLLDRVFEPFFTTKPRGKGTGLGLAMVYGFAKQSGGYVNIYSEEGHGTCVKLYLPRYAADPAAPRDEHGRPLEDAEPRTTATVLIVEDDPALREVAVMLVTDLGYQVIDCSDALAALQVLERRDDVDVVFTDIVMPGGIDGLRLGTMLRSMRPGLPVIYTSGYTQNSPFDNGDTVHWLSKPYTRDKVGRKLREVLEAQSPDPTSPNPTAARPGPAARE